MKQTITPAYLEPYLRAADQHGAGFQSLLWASPKTQAVRFDALARAYDFSGASVLDVGCGRADLLDYFLQRDIRPNDYIGLEAVNDLARAAEAKNHPHCQIIRADFIADSRRMFVGADVVVFSGSLNTLGKQEFYLSLRRAFDACADSVAFNFLASPALAGKDYLTWHRPGDVLAFARSLHAEVSVFDDYLDGDCTLLMRKQS